jgi:transcriptional regulator of acetoin/glycerol metabolism
MEHKKYGKQKHNAHHNHLGLTTEHSVVQWSFATKGAQIWIAAQSDEVLRGTYISGQTREMNLHHANPQRESTRYEIKTTNPQNYMDEVKAKNNTNNNTNNNNNEQRRSKPRSTREATAREEKGDGTTSTPTKHRKKKKESTTAVRELE